MCVLETNDFCTANAIFYNEQQKHCREQVHMFLLVLSIVIEMYFHTYNDNIMHSLTEDRRLHLHSAEKCILQPPGMHASALRNASIYTSLYTASLIMRRVINIAINMHVPCRGTCILIPIFCH